MSDQKPYGYLHMHVLKDGTNEVLRSDFLLMENRETWEKDAKFYGDNPVETVIIPLFKKDDLQNVGKISHAPSSPYNLKRIGWELERTALNDGYYGNALYVAKDIPGLSVDEKALLDRFITGITRDADHVGLQDLALKIYEMDEASMMEPVASIEDWTVIQDGHPYKRLTDMKTEDLHRRGYRVIGYVLAKDDSLCVSCNSAVRWTDAQELFNFIHDIPVES